MTDHRSRLTRRTALKAGAGGLALVTSGGFASLALAQRKPAGPETVAIDALMKPTALPELFIGKADAPVTIVEYASMTCGHCATFHTKVFPSVKEKYVDTGKVRFIFREFPLEDFALAASMLGRCTGTPEKAFAMVSVLFGKQEEWAFTRDNRVAALFKIAKQAGFTQEAFDKCLADDKMRGDIAAARERATKEFGVNATPTFFINGKRFTDRSDQVESFTKAIDAALPKS